MNYSQNNEQEAILRYFNGRNGKFLEIGAFDGVEFSNTRALLEAGWRGVLVEPDPRNLCALIKNTLPFHDRCSILACAVSASRDCLSELLLDDTEGRGWASTMGRCRTGVLRRSSCRLYVPIMHITELCTQWDGFEFISIDAEGEDFGILKAMPAKTLEVCRLLCVEPHDSTEREQMRGFLDGHGFKTYHETPENLIVSRA